MSALVDLPMPVLPRMDRLVHLPVAVIGAGPVGLAAAAHLLERGIEPVVFEAGETAGSAVLSWGHVRLFSPWEFALDAACVRLLERNGWKSPNPGALPTGAELVAGYLAPLAELLAPHIRLGTRVRSVTREGMDRTRSAGRATTPFRLLVEESGGRIADQSARAVIDSSGTYLSPNPLGANGLVPAGAAAVADRLVPALPDVLGRDRDRFAGKHVLVVGAGHSAANTLLALAALALEEPATTLTWAIRTALPVRVYGSSEDELSQRAALGSGLRELVLRGDIALIDNFEIDSLAPAGEGVAVHGRRRGRPAEVLADVIVVATGFRPDLDLLREIRLGLDEVIESPRALAPLIDPNLHSCGTVPPHGEAALRHPEPNFYLAGMKSYGRAPTFLLATGYEQVRSIAAALAGDRVAADQVRLTLPATGVCSSTTESGGADCCA